MEFLGSITIIFLIALIFGFGFFLVTWIEIETSKEMRREIKEEIKK